MKVRVPLEAAIHRFLTPGKTRPLLLFVPVRTDSPVRRMPLINHSIIALNIAIFLATDVIQSSSVLENPLIYKSRYSLDPTDLHLSQFITYQFLHGDLMHLLGNMLFLWVFGNSVNARMGNLAYLLFYLACGVFAGVGFAVTSVHSCLGSSGAIAGITTAYLVMFPQARVTVFYWLWLYIGTMHIQALWLIFGKIILWDNIIAPRLTADEGPVQVAYSAHIAGYLFGFAACWLMVLVRAVPRDQFDLVAIARRAYQRERLRAMMSQPDAVARATYGRVARPISAGDMPQVDDEITRRRGDIADLLSARDYVRAAERYEELIARDPQQCLSRRQMLDIANQLMSMNRYPQAAAAYEKYLKAYPGDGETNQIKLILGIIYAKYLAQYESAQSYLRECLARLTNPDQLQQAHHWLEEAIEAHRRQGPSTA